MATSCITPMTLDMWHQFFNTPDCKASIWNLARSQSPSQWPGTLRWVGGRDPKKKRTPTYLWLSNLVGISPSLFPPQNGRGWNPYKLEILWKWRLGNGVGTYHFIAQGGYWTGWWCGMMLWYWTSRKNQPFCKEDWLHFVGVQLGHTWTGVNMVAIL